LRSLPPVLQCDSKRANKQISGLRMIRYVSICSDSCFARVAIANDDARAKQSSIEGASNRSGRFLDHFPEPQ
jgi:hypothetical protein